MYWKEMERFTGTVHLRGISTVTYQIPTELEAGIYTLDAAAMGQIGDTVTLQILNEQGEVLFTGTPTEMTGWTLNLEECQTPSVNFELKETTTVKLQIVLNITAGGWGKSGLPESSQARKIHLSGSRERYPSDSLRKLWHDPQRGKLYNDIAVS